MNPSDESWLEGGKGKGGRADRVIHAPQRGQEDARWSPKVETEAGGGSHEKGVACRQGDLELDEAGEDRAVSPSTLCCSAGYMPPPPHMRTVGLLLSKGAWEPAAALKRMEVKCQGALPLAAGS